MSSKLPCPCGACQGKLVSSYVCHQHMKKFVVGGDSSASIPNNTSDVDAGPVTEDITETPGIDPDVSMTTLVSLSDIF